MNSKNPKEIVIQNCIYMINIAFKESKFKKPHLTREEEEEYMKWESYIVSLASKEESTWVD